MHTYRYHLLFVLVILLLPSLCVIAEEEDELPSKEETYSFLAEHLPWIKDGLEELRKEEPEEFEHELEEAKEILSHFRYIEQQDRELALKLLKAEKLEHQSESLAEAIREMPEGEKREAAAKRLRGLLQEIFDARMAGRQFELEEFESEIIKLRQTIERRKQMRAKIIKRRFQDLVEFDEEELEWW